ncbi:Fc.00g002820.m01.CDS01 [Cosmosporella sp. VM-42]
MTQEHDHRILQASNTAAMVIKALSALNSALSRPGLWLPLLALDAKHQEAHVEAVN